MRRTLGTVQPIPRQTSLGQSFRPTEDASPTRPGSYARCKSMGEAFGTAQTLWGTHRCHCRLRAVLSGFAGSWHAYETVVAPKVPPVAVTPRPPAFSIAILPFASPGATAADELIARELAPDLTDTIGRTSRLIWVVSPRLAENYANKPIDPRAVGRELNVHYLVEGKLRRTGDRLLLTATLTEATTATQIWSHKVEVADAETEGTSMALSRLLLGLRTLYTKQRCAVSQRRGRPRRVQSIS